MSGILLPMIHPTLTIDGTGDTINVDAVLSISTVTALKPTGTNFQDKNVIVFTLGMGNNPREVTWKYADSTLRDADLVTIKALISAAIT